VSRYRIAILAAIAATSACAVQSQSTEPLSFHVGGRTVAEIHGGRTRHTYTWPGVYFEARFSGGTVGVDVNDDQNELNLYVDGVLQLVLPRTGRRSVTLTDLGEGKHTVRLEKVSETQGPTGAFLGFFVPAADRLLPPPQYEQAIEFIGDSYTVGYGNTSTGRECSESQVRETTNTSMAFGPLVAKSFNADYRVHAASGFGMVRNYANGHPGFTMPVLYDRWLYNEQSTTNEDDWEPDVIVIGLGTNDFSTPLGDNEQWDDGESLRSNFRDAYTEFVIELDQETASTHFVLMASRDSNGEILEAVNAVAAELANRGLDNVSVLTFDDLDMQGCNYHPSIGDHQKLATLLIEKLLDLPDFRRTE